MNTELKQKWVEALRSGEYRQIRGRLNDYDNGYCCLGVLCKVAGYEVIGTNILENEKIVVENYIAIDNLIKDDSYDVSYFIQLNDNNRYTFDEIAEYVEKNL
jgi:hypothetical protein